jgi:hypothetical protein
MKFHYKKYIDLNIKNYYYSKRLTLNSVCNMIHYISNVTIR